MKSKTMYGFPLSMVLFQMIGLILLSLLVLAVFFISSITFGIISALILPLYILFFIIRSEKRFIQLRKQILNMMISQVNLKGDEKILDLGTGAGYIAVGFAKQLTTGSVVGIDKYDIKPKNMISTMKEKIKINFFGNTLQNARENARTEGQLKKINFVKSDISSKIPFDKYSFDIVVSSQFLYCISQENLAKVLYDINRVLKPDGMLVFFESKRFFNWDLNQVIRFFGLKGYDYNICSLQNCPNKVIYVGIKPKKNLD